MPLRPQLSLPTRERRATVVGAGSFGTAVAVLLALAVAIAGTVRPLEADGQR